MIEWGEAKTRFHTTLNKILYHCEQLRNLYYHRKAIKIITPIAFLVCPAKGVPCGNLLESGADPCQETRLDEGYVMRAIKVFYCGKQPKEAFEGEAISLNVRIAVVIVGKVGV